MSFTFGCSFLVVLVVVRVLIRTNSGKLIIFLRLCLFMFFGCCNYMIYYDITLYKYVLELVFYVD